MRAKRTTTIQTIVVELIARKQGRRRTRRNVSGVNSHACVVIHACKYSIGRLMHKRLKIECIMCQLPVPALRPPTLCKMLCDSNKNVYVCVWVRMCIYIYTHKQTSMYVDIYKNLKPKVPKLETQTSQSLNPPTQRPLNPSTQNPSTPQP